MDISQAQRLLRQIEKTSLQDLKRSLFKSAINYACIRADWHELTVTERIQNEFSRTAAHNRFIDECNILSRNMKKIDESVTWRIELGDDRQEIGDFACYLHCIFGLRVR